MDKQVCGRCSQLNRFMDCFPVCMETNMFRNEDSKCDCGKFDSIKKNKNKDVSEIGESETRFLKLTLEKLKDIKEGLTRQGFLTNFTQTQLLNSVKELLTEIEDTETIDT